MYPRIEPYREKIISRHIRQVQDDPSLVLYYPFIDPTSSIVQDYSGKGNHGTRYGTTAMEINGKTALSFDGIDDYIEISKTITSPNITFISWFMRTGPGDAGVLRLCTEAKSPFSFEFGVGKDSFPGKLVFYLAFIDETSTGWVDTGYDVENDVWYFTAISWNGIVKTYVNRNIIYSDDTWTGKTLNSGPIRIGGTGSTSGHFDGLIALPRIYNRTVSPAEIKNIYEMERDIFGV